jgi:hypothetical protein
MMTNMMNGLPQTDNIDAARQDRQRSIPGFWFAPPSHAVSSIIFRMQPIGKRRRDVCP